MSVEGVIPVRKPTCLRRAIRVRESASEGISRGWSAIFVLQHPTSRASILASAREIGVEGTEVTRSRDEYGPLFSSVSIPDTLIC